MIIKSVHKKEFYYNHATFNLSKIINIKNRIKTESKSLTQLSHYCQKSWFFAKKNADISKIMEVLVLKSIFSKTTHVCVLSNQISNF